MPKKEKISMAELTSGYEKFIKGKELNKNGKGLFNKIINKAAKATKLRGSK